MEPHVELARRLGTVPDPLASEGVADLERRYAVRLPDDFRFYLLNAAPPDMCMCDDGYTWWPVGRIRNLPEECHDFTSRETPPRIACEADRYLVFADYLLWSYAWAICCSDTADCGRVALIGEKDLTSRTAFLTS